MKLFAKKSTYTKKQLRQSKPVRNPSLSFDEAEGGEVVIRVPVKLARTPTRLLSKLFSAPKERLVELEPVGAIVWRLCDGRHTFGQICSALQSQFGLSKIEAEASLVSFLETLTKRNYVSLEVPKR